MVRPGHGGAGGQQDQRVQQRQMPGIEGLDILRRPHAADEFGAQELVRVGREQGGVEIGPEPGDEEHHLGGDEQDHPVAVGNLHHAGVIAGLRFADHVAPPADHRVDHAERAGGKDQRRRGEALVHPGDGAHRQDEGRDRSDHRPGTRIHQVIIVVLGMRASHVVLRLDPQRRIRADYSLNMILSENRSRFWGSCSPKFVRARPAPCSPRQAAAVRAADRRCRTRSWSDRPGRPDRSRAPGRYRRRPSWRGSRPASWSDR